MKHLVYLAALLAVATLNGIAGVEAEEIRSCDFEVKARCVSGDARVTLADGTVQRLEVNVIWCGQGGGPGYTCTIDSSRKDQDSRWSEDKGAAIIANAAPWNASQPDRMKVTVDGVYQST